MRLLPCWFGSRFHLVCIPLVKRRLVFGDDVEHHVRVLKPAEFGALAAIHARPVGPQRYLIYFTGDQVPFAMQVWDPEAVYHVRRGEGERYRLTHGHVQFVRSGYPLTPG